jgi:hypothetical protein
VEVANLLDPRKVAERFRQMKLVINAPDDVEPG